ncbi:MFS transporter [Pelomonas cellulosilytica]|uniref:MFS transporter n=1 Tax=Pelomonas cellulosilytica TaxID=2906762 RepID=A0ABS8XSB4_9BURK|nr:MFS transporter [Pelomonas sp. P8]MCE4555611.1 MFS transporter [Pelomonas sp. P8]
MPLRRPPLIPAEFLALLRTNPALGRLLAVDVLVLVGELGMAVILPWWITGQGGAAAITTFSVTLAVVGFFIAPAVSPFGDRLCKTCQIRGGLGGLALVAALLTTLSATGAFHVVTLAVLAGLQAGAAAFVDPARETVLAELVAPAQLPTALRLRKALQALGGVLGPLLAGAALGVAGVAPALEGCAGLLLFALAVAWRLPRTAAAPSRPRALGAWWGDLCAGLAAKWHVPMERGWTAVNFIVWIFQGPAVGLLVPLKVQSLGLAGAWLGLSLGALSLGVLLGSLFGAQRLVRRFGRYRVRVGLGCLEGVALAAAGLAGAPGLLLAALLAAGFCNASMSLVGATHRALAIPREYRVRLLAAGAMTTRVAGAIGPALVGAALVHHSVAHVYTVWGLMMAACVLGFLAVPRLREFLSLGHDEIADWYRRQYPAVFR